MAISDRLNKLTTDITSAYTSIENKGGTIPSNKNTNNLSTAIDSIQSSNIIGATAEGESLSLANTKAMPYNDFVVEGKSEQETRSGKNLLNVTATTRTMNGVTITVNQDKSITLNGTNTSSETIFYRLADNFNLPAGTYTLSNHNNNVSNNNFIFYDDNYNFEERYNVVTKTFNTQKTIKPYLKVAAGITLNNEIIYPMIEKNSFMTDYEPYGASPSPSNPSDINSVADDVNLFDKEATISSTGFITSYTYSNGIYTIIPTGTGNPQIRLNVSIPQGTYILNSNTSLSIATILRNNNNLLNNFQDAYQNQVFTITETSSELVFNWLNPNNTNPITLDLRTLKIQKGTVATPYSPYNQGTVTIKQRGKNLFDIENYSKSGYNVTITNPLKGLIAGDYTISCQNKHTAGSAIIFSNEINGSRIGEYFTGYDFGRTLTSKTRALTQEQLNAKYMIFQGQDSSITQEVLENMQIQIEKDSTATSYEPYQANDYTFQTEPLRSLPNGVKDTIEAEQHRKIGKQTGTLTETTTITLSDAKTNGAYMCNIKPSGTLTGKTIELEAGDYEIIYELEEETIEPLTQNQATTMLDIIKTGSYESTTNIYTDEDVKPTIEVDYYKKV